MIEIIENQHITEIDIEGVEDGSVCIDFFEVNKGNEKVPRLLVWVDSDPEHEDPDYKIPLKENSEEEQLSEKR